MGLMRTLSLSLSLSLSLIQSAKNGLGDDNLIPQQLDWPDFLKSVCLLLLRYCYIIKSHAFLFAP